MKIQHLNLFNFRNIERLSIDFGNSYNIIYGNNGAGKTNLVESIYYLALTKTFRNSLDKIIIMKNKSKCKIEGTIEKKYDYNYKIILDNRGKAVFVNNSKIDKISDYISKMSIVLFSPDSLRFIKESPSIRRNYINLEISQINNNYLKILNNYNRILKQRNSFLKKYKNDDNSNNYLNILTNNLIDCGLEIFKFRMKYINLINKSIGGFYEKICGLSNLRFEYYSQYNELNKKDLLDKYNKLKEKECLFKKTLIGIHYDDFKILINDLLIKDYGSEGQQKNAIIAFKLAEIELFNDIKKEYPILILDDLFSELDKEKINNILKLINSNIQTFITTTDLDKIDNNILKNSYKYFVDNGNVRIDDNETGL